GITFFFSIVPTLFIKEPRSLTEAPAATADTPALKDSKKINRSGLMKIYIAHAFTWLGVQTMFVYIFAFISQFKFSITDTSLLEQSQKDEIGQIIAIAFAILNTVGFILPAPVLEPLTRKIGRVRTHIACIFIMALGYWGIVFLGHSAIVLYLLMAVAGIGWASVVSLPFAIMTEMVDKSKMGLFMGIFNLSVVIPQLVVSLFLGSFIQAADNKVLIFVISAVSLTISGLLWMLVKERKEESAEK
ncbi:MAG TPA: MFS transporter, partial [Bacteroidales bacterium]|nr:MFS transporter [Bacteroidales bacterium]